MSFSWEKRGIRNFYGGLPDATATNTPLTAKTMHGKIIVAAVGPKAGFSTVGSFPRANSDAVASSWELAGTSF